jgi:hypothetical protein
VAAHASNSRSQDHLLVPNATRRIESVGVFQAAPIPSDANTSKPGGWAPAHKEDKNGCCLYWYIEVDAFRLTNHPSAPDEELQQGKELDYMN